MGLESRVAGAPPTPWKKQSHRTFPSSPCCPCGLLPFARPGGDGLVRATAAAVSLFSTRTTDRARKKSLSHPLFLFYPFLLSSFHPTPAPHSHHEVLHHHHCRRHSPRHPGPCLRRPQGPRHRYRPIYPFRIRPCLF